MEKWALLILRGAVIFLAAVMLALCIFLPPGFAGEVAQTRLAYLRLPFYINMYAAAIPVLFILCQAFMLLNYIKRGLAFSKLSLKALKRVQIACYVLCAVLLAAMFIAVPIAEADDAPGLILIAFALACSPLVCAAASLVLQKLLQEGIASSNT